jgi:hypothetical protein
LIVVSGSLLVACTAAAPGVTSEQAAASNSSSAPPAPPAAGATASEPRTVADIFPPGPGRDQVLTGCASCHNVACAAIGQRSAARWDALRDGHKEHMQGADLSVMFAYLKSNFDDTKPAPIVPARFLEGGCTPF